MYIMPTLATRKSYRRYMKNAGMSKAYKSVRRTQAVPKATKRYVKTAIKASKETNYQLIDNSQQSVSYDVPFLAMWSSIAQGDTIRTREGDRIEPTNLRMSYQVRHEDPTFITRIILFQWKPDTNVDAPSMAKILEVPNVANSVFFPYMQDTVDRAKFVVLKDIIHSGNKEGLTIPSFTHTVNINKFANKYINFNEANATTGKSLIYCLAISNRPSTDVEPTFNKIVYLRWKDD